MAILYILKGKEPVPTTDLIAWAEWMERHERLVKADMTVDENGSVIVSTVFLGCDYNVTGKEPPILFETLIFGGKLDGRMWRYPTWELAEKNHENVWKMVQANSLQTKEKDGAKNH